jgi:hypothetical protein
MAPDDIDRIYRALEDMNRRLSEHGEMLAALTAAAQHPPVRPCPDLILLQERHLEIASRLDRHIGDHSEIRRSWRAVAFSGLERLVGWAIVAIVAYVVARGVH